MTPSDIAIIIGAILSSSVLQTVITQVCQKGDKKELTHQTLAAVAYWALSGELEKLLSQGYATPEERKALSILYDAYHANGWNGDMDIRMKKVYASPTQKIT